MCGFVGIMKNGVLTEAEKSDISKMEEYVVNRGPDQRGSFENNHSMFIHRRLSVLGDNYEGQQPMLSDCGKWLLVFNGEIYNFKTLAQQFGIRSSRSDTRVFVQLISKLGVEKTISLLNGMYAFVAINLANQECYFASDHFGQKPLYFSHEGSKITFASDLRSFNVGARSVNKIAEDYFLRAGYIPKGMSFLNGVQKAEPSHIYCFNCGQTTAFTKPSKEYSARAIDVFDLGEAIKQHLVSDYRVFTFLSSGMDSAIVSSLAARHSNIESFTFSLGNSVNDETAHASKIAKHIGIQNHVITSHDIDVASMFENLHTILSEPLGDPAALALHIMCKSVKNFGFKVGLTGDGGDEIFGGYSSIENKYNRFGAKKKWAIPTYLRNAGLPTKIGREIKRKLLIHDNSITSNLDLQFVHSAGDFFGYSNGPASDRQALIKVLKANNFNEFYTGQIQSKFAPKIDLASSNCGVELRVPLLSDNLIGLLGTRATKIRVYEQLIPEHLRNYQKLGFAVDLKRMMEKYGKAWVNDCVSDAHQFYPKAIVRRLKLEAVALEVGLADITFLYRYCQAIAWQRAYT